MTTDEALDIVARYALVSHHHDEPIPAWEDYPEIGEHDWHRVIDLVDALLPAAPSDDEYHAAYSLLTSRAEPVA